MEPTHPCRLVLVVKTTGKTDRLDADIHLASEDDAGVK